MAAAYEKLVTANVIMTRALAAIMNMRPAPSAFDTAREIAARALKAAEEASSVNTINGDVNVAGNVQD